MNIDNLSPFQFLGMDVVGPLNKTRRGNRYILVVTDYATKWAESFPMKNQESETIAEFIIQVILRFGTPETILSDRGENFNSELMKYLFERFSNIIRVTSTSYSPQTNANTERFNRTLGGMLRTCEDKLDWDLNIPFVNSAYNTSVHTGSKYTPFELVNARKYKFPIDVKLANETNYNQSKIKNIKSKIDNGFEAREIALENLKKSQQNYAYYYNLNRNDIEFEVGDYVFVNNPGEHIKKIESRWYGPFKIIEKISRLNYRLELPQDHSRKHDVFHIRRLKKYNHNPKFTFGNKSSNIGKPVLPENIKDFGDDDFDFDLFMDFNLPSYNPVQINNVVNVPQLDAESDYSPPISPIKRIINSQQQAQKENTIEESNELDTTSEPNVIEPNVISDLDNSKEEILSDDSSEVEKSQNEIPDGEYELEEIVKHILEDGVNWYLVKWKGYKKKKWIPEENFTNAKQMLEQFKKKNGIGQKKSKRKPKK